MEVSSSSILFCSEKHGALHKCSGMQYNYCVYHFFHMEREVYFPVSVKSYNEGNLSSLEKQYNLYNIT